MPIYKSDLELFLREWLLQTPSYHSPWLCVLLCLEGHLLQAYFWKPCFGNPLETAGPPQFDSVKSIHPIALAFP